jgi:hypothetical protein
MITETLEMIKKLVETTDISEAMKIQYELGLDKHEIYQIIVENNQYFHYHEKFIEWLNNKSELH